MKKKKPLQERSWLAQNIVMRRKALSLSAEELAEKAGLAVQTVRGIENDHSKGWEFTREALANALNCSLADLYSQPGSKDPDPLIRLYPDSPRQGDTFGGIRKSAYQRLRPLLALLSRLQNRQLLHDDVSKLTDAHLAARPERQKIVLALLFDEPNLVVDDPDLFQEFLNFRKLSKTPS